MRMKNEVVDFSSILSYTARTKAIVALAVISSISLGVLVILTHFTSYVTHDRFITWLVRGGSVAMALSCICMLAILIIMGTSKHEDARGVFGDLLVQDFVGNRHSAFSIPAILASSVRLDELSAGNNLTNATSMYQEGDYSVRVGWSFGIEIVALAFTLSTAVIYGLMLTAKRRPE